MKAAVSSWVLTGCLLASACGPARHAEDRIAPPDVRRAFDVEFDGGTLHVVTGECEAVDPDTIRDWADRAYRDLSAAWPDRTDRFRAEGLTMVGMLDAVTRKGRSVNGYWDRERQTIVFKCGVEIVIRHELFHVWCERGGLPCDCARIDHPGGFDLECRPKP